MKLFPESLQNHHFGVISNNCWGAEVYKSFGLAYQSPFVGLFLPSSCYIRLLQNLPEFLYAKPEFTRHSRYDLYQELRKKEGAYPLALLGGEIEIHFLHYHSQEEALEKWQRRLERLPTENDNLFFKFCDRELMVSDEAELFDRLPYKNKLFFCANPYKQLASAIHIKEFTGMTQVVDGKALYPFCRYYVDIASWLNGNENTPSLYTQSRLGLRRLKHQWGK